MKFYDFSAKKMNGQEVKMEEFKGKVVLVVNTASKCGLTPQFTELEELNKKYNVFIVSNCQEGYLRTFLEYYDFNKYVLDYEEAGRTGMPKDENIRLVIKRNHLDKAFYVGDTLGDMESTDKAGIPFIHAAYGFGTVPADRMKINNIKELPEFIDDLLSKDTDN